MLYYTSHSFMRLNFQIIKYLSHHRYLRYCVLSLGLVSNFIHLPPNIEMLKCLL